MRSVGTFGAVNTYKNSDYLPKVESILVRKEKICKLLGQDFEVSSLQIP